MPRITKSIALISLFFLICISFAACQEQDTMEQTRLQTQVSVPATQESQHAQQQTQERSQTQQSTQQAQTQQSTQQTQAQQSTQQTQAQHSTQQQKETQTFTVTWQNYDGTVLEVSSNVAYGDTPSYNGATPVRGRDGLHTYTFCGWSPAINNVTGNVTYVAQYTSLAVEMESVKMARSQIVLLVGETQKVSVSVTYSPTGAAPSREYGLWQIADTSIATVDTAGNVTAVKGGTTTLTFTYTPTGHQTTCEIQCYKFNLPNCPLYLTKRNTYWESVGINSYIVYQLRIDSVVINVKSVYTELTCRGIQVEQESTAANKRPISYRVLDSNNTVLISGKLSTPAIRAGESFVSSTGMLFYDQLPPAEYTIVFD